MEKVFQIATGRREAREERLKVYRDLVRTRIEDVLSTTFPVFRRFTGDQFEKLVSEFLPMPHRSPLLMDLPGEFLEFFRSKRTSLKDRLPFLEDLMVYEWLESALFNAPEEGTSTFSWEGNYRFSASSRLASFRYPVHRAEEMEAEDLLEREGAYHLLLFRDPEDLIVKQVELTDFVYTFLKGVGGGRKPEEVLRALKPEDLELEDLKPYLERFMGDLCSKGVLVSRSSRHS
ncbi:MAG: putative DNA-binding domain-containing protein [Aquificota bacterium]|nr:putative DNA-binding domain-containing protein [Aquificota bacterium]